MIIALCALGWLLFAFVTCLHLVGLRINARDEFGLSAFVLAVILSDGFREGVKDVYTQSIQESRDHDPKYVLRKLVDAVKQGSKRDEPLMVVFAAIEQLSSSG